MTLSVRSLIGTSSCRIAPENKKIVLKETEQVYYPCTSISVCISRGTNTENEKTPLPTTVETVSIDTMTEGLDVPIMKHQSSQTLSRCREDELKGISSTVGRKGQMVLRTKKSIEAMLEGYSKTTFIDPKMEMNVPCEMLLEMHQILKWISERN